MTRSDYNPEMVENFRKQVLDYIVPVATSLYNRQGTFRIWNPPLFR